MTAEQKKDNLLPDMSTPEAVVAAVLSSRKNYPANRMTTFFQVEYYLKLKPEDQKRVNKIISSALVEGGKGIEMTSYANTTHDYEDFAPIWDPMVQDYHGIDKDFRYKEDWDITGKDLDLAKIDPKLSNVSMRVRVARNVEGFPMTAAMTQEDRVAFEDYMITTVFEKLVDNPKYGGRYVSLTPGSKYEISNEEYEKLVEAHQMFKDMSDDPWLTAGGISGDWPYGRGMYISEDEQKIVWVNEEDQLRIMNMQRGSNLSTIFNGLHEELELIEELGVNFARSENYGYVTSCGSNLGTGMRASLHLKLPTLTENGKNVDKLKKILKEENLAVSVRGAGGESTDAGSDGLVDISPRGRMIPEKEVITQLYQAAAKLAELEQTTV